MTNGSASVRVGLTLREAGTKGSCKWSSLVGIYKVKSWAKTVGSSTEKFIHYILDNHAEKKALTILLSFKNLTKYYSDELIEKSCDTLMTISQAPSLSVLKTILKRMKESQSSKENGTLNDTKTDNDYGFVRGAKYFGGVKNEE